MPALTACVADLRVLILPGLMPNLLGVRDAASVVFALDVPATPEKLRMAAGDQLVAPYVADKEEGWKPLMSC
jgi:hypothetical protein